MFIDGQTSKRYTVCSVYLWRGRASKIAESFFYFLIVFYKFPLMIIEFHTPSFIFSRGSIGCHFYEHLVYLYTLLLVQTAVIQACGIVTEHMRKDKGGSGGTIINVSSIAGLSKFSILYKIQS